jgi:hypothetical protein
LIIQCFLLQHVRANKASLQSLSVSSLTSTLPTTSSTAPKHSPDKIFLIQAVAICNTICQSVAIQAVMHFCLKVATARKGFVKHLWHNFFLTV